MKQQTNEEIDKLTPEQIVVFIANCVYGYNGSDPEVQKKQQPTGIATSVEAYNAFITATRLSTIQEVEKLKKEKTKCPFCNLHHAIDGTML